MEEEVEQTRTTGEEGLPDPAADPRAEREEHGERGERKLTVQDRVRSEPDFAWEQVQKRDARIAELTNKVKQYDVVDPYLQAAGGADGLLSYASQGMQIQSVPGLADFVQQSIKSGRVALPEQEAAKPDDPNDEWMDEDTKRIRDESRSEIRALKDELVELKRMASSASTRSLETHVRANVSKALELFEKDPDASAEATSIIETRVKQAMRLAESGDETQQRLIDQLAQPNGHESLEYMLLPLMKKYGNKLFSASQTETQENGEATVVPSTDDRARNPSRPGTPPMKPLPKGTVMTPQVAMQVFREIERRNGHAAR